MSAGKRVRQLTLLVSLLAVLLSATAPLVQARGPSPEQLDARGWTCFMPPSVPHLMVCYNRGLGRPIPGNPDPPPSYSLLAFSASSGEFLFTGHLVRADLYGGQPCGNRSDDYIFRAVIGYFECLHT